MKNARYYRAFVPALCACGFVVLFVHLSRMILFEPIAVAGPGLLAGEAAVSLLGWLVCLICVFPGEREELFSILVHASPSSMRFLYRPVGWSTGISGSGGISAPGLGR
jgi:hypothetical protein